MGVGLTVLLLLRCLVFKRYRLFLGIKCQWFWCAPRGNRQGRTPHGGVPQIGVHPCRLPRVAHPKRVKPGCWGGLLGSESWTWGFAWTWGFCLDLGFLPKLPGPWPSLRVLRSNIGIRPQKPLQPKPDAVNAFYSTHESQTTPHPLHTIWCQNRRHNPALWPARG